MTDTRLAAERYFELIDADTERLLAMGERGLKAPVPSCPGWDVAEVLWHTANVYEHKVRVMADNGWPDPWPPGEYDSKEELAFLREAKQDLFDEFARHELTEQTTTFSADDPTIAFWVRRMALEVAIHRYDAELAHDDPTAHPDDESIDGIDEVLKVTLAGPWWESRVETAHPIEALVAIESGGVRWLCDVQRQSITIGHADTAAALTISGEPPAVFRWLWGRAGDDEIAFDGDASLAIEFRLRLVECTG